MQIIKIHAIYSFRIHNRIQYAAKRNTASPEIPPYNTYISFQTDFLYVCERDLFNGNKNDFDRSLSSCHTENYHMLKTRFYLYCWYLCKQFSVWLQLTNFGKLHKKAKLETDIFIKIATYIFYMVW